MLVSGLSPITLSGCLFYSIPCYRYSSLPRRREKSTHLGQEARLAGPTRLQRLETGRGKRNSVTLSLKQTVHTLASKCTYSRFNVSRFLYLYRLLLLFFAVHRHSWEFQTVYLKCAVLFPSNKVLLFTIAFTTTCHFRLFPVEMYSVCISAVYGLLPLCAQCMNEGIVTWGYQLGLMRYKLCVICTNSFVDMAGLLPMTATHCA